MDATLCREHVKRLLVEENAVLAELESQLDREHEALAARNLEALESAADTRQLHMQRLLKIEDERRTACSMHGFAPDLRGLAQLIAWCDPKRTLASFYEECVTRAERCRASNDRNAALVAARMSRIENMLGALAGPAGQTPSYGPGAKSRTPLAGGRLNVEA